VRGRQVFMESLLAHGTGFIFGNPGTTESPLLDALPDYPGLRYIVALQESIALCAASFYAQASGKTAIINLHVAPGLGNAMGMLHAAWRSNAPLIVTAGQQDTRMRLRDPVLGHDLVAMATPLTKWSVQVERADEFALVMRRAFKIANDPPCGPVFVGLPIDVMEQETTNGPVRPGPLFKTAPPDPKALAEAAALVLAAKSPVIVSGDDVARSGAVDALVRLAVRIGAPAWCEGLRQHISFPTAHANARNGLPLDAAAIAKSLAGSDLVLLVGGPFFEEVWYAPGSPFPPSAKVIQIEEAPARLAYNHAVDLGLVGDLGSALDALESAIAAGATSDYRARVERTEAANAARKRQEKEAQEQRARKAWDRLPISMPRVMAEIAKALPREAIVVDESITASIDLARTLDFARPGDFFGGRGGGIGQGLAGAIGVKVARPDRPVICISGDGSAMYSIQALWTAAHHGLAIVFVILSNREYRILKHNIDVYRQRFDIRSNRAYQHMDLTGPDLGFVDMARGMGVAGTAVTMPEDIGPAIEAALKSGKPHVVDITIEGKQ
jgi:benzoylformate decarboxylase